MLEKLIEMCGSAKDAALVLGVSEVTVNRWLSGARNISTDMMSRVSYLLIEENLWAKQIAVYSVELRRIERGVHEGERVPRCYPDVKMKRDEAINKLSEVML